ncbi:unnamed protein product [Phytophthora fragariaefolia]|uniref:Unnamed protein product n=1 Tax=Phytophthora fragariaefolia TaxID=1490495 RepID=A0A9W6Y748_9STRA|nr:unnamed protein product [Phytophthora fragariaefolia]
MGTVDPEGCERSAEATGDENTPPGETEAAEVAPSAPAPPESSTSTGTEASVPEVTPLRPTGVLGSDAVDAVDDTGDVVVRGIGENGGFDPLGTDANESTPLSAGTAMPEAGADEVETETAESVERTLCEGPLPLAAAEAACFTAFGVFKSTEGRPSRSFFLGGGGADRGLPDDFAGLLGLPFSSPLKDPEEVGGVGPEPTEDPEAAGGGGIANCSAPNSSKNVAKAAGIADTDAELAPPETELCRSLCSKSSRS